MKRSVHAYVAQAEDFLNSARRWLWRRPPRPGIEVSPHVFVRQSALDQYNGALAVETSLSARTLWSDVRPDLERAERQLRRALDTAPLFRDAHRALGRNLWFQGRHAEALTEFATAERKRIAIAELAGWEPDARVSLPRDCATVFGCMGHIDSFVKQSFLSNDARPYYLLADGRVANKVFLDYWRRYFDVITDPEEVRRLTRFEPAYASNWNWALWRGDAMAYLHVGIADVQRRWAALNRAPLLKLTDEHSDMLTRQKKAWGMGVHDWFVALHVRSAGYYGEAASSAQAFRNTPIESYYPAICAVVDRGGWVIRMGDASMPPLDMAQLSHSKRVIDYARSSAKSEALDIALCAGCRLLLSASSGVQAVVGAFGRPRCLVNLRMSAGLPWNPGDIFIPAQHRTRAGRMLSLEEMTASDVIFADHQWLLDKAGVILSWNEPAEIEEAAIEALDPDGYTVPEPERAEAVAARFDDLNMRCGAEISGRLGKHYAWMHADTLLRAA